ncbi:LamG-like jellyroll fold domain-containing protein [Planctomycetota bacterium]
MRNSSWLMCLGALCAVLFAAAPAAEAGLVDWLAEVGAGTPAEFVDTNIVGPTTRDIGALSGDKTYEFIVDASNAGGSSTLIGVRGAAPNAAIKFEQWNNTNRYGVTRFGVADYQFPTPPITIDEPVHLAFVFDNSLTRTTLFVDGVQQSSIDALLELSGQVGVGATWPSVTDALDGTIIGLATYNSQLPPPEILAHAEAVDRIPEPATLSLLAFGGLGLIARRRKQR